MKRILRYLGIAAAVLVGLVIVAVIVIPLVVNPNDYRDRISQLVQDKTGRELTIKGDIKLSVFPWLGLELGQTSLSDAPGFGKAPFARIDDAEVRVRLLPLLRGKVEVGAVQLDGLSVNLIRDKSGKNNWQDLAGQGRKAPAKPAAKSGGAPSIAIGGVKIDDANLSFTDAQAGSHYAVKHLNVSLGSLAPGAPMPVKLAAELDSKKPAASAKLALDGTARLDLAHGSYAFDGATLKIDAHGAMFPGKALAAVLKWKSAAFDGGAGTAKVDGLEFSAYDLRGTLSVSGKGLDGKAPAFAGSLQVPTFSARKLLADIGKPQEMADPKALTRVAARLRFAATSHDARVDGLTVDLDGSKLTGDAAVTDFKTGAARFKLALDKIDLDRYLPPAAQKPAGGGKSNIDAMPLPVKPLRGLELDGSIHVGKLHGFSINSTDIDVGISAHAGQVHLQPLAAKLYGGTYDGDIRLDARRAALGVSMDEHVKTVNLGALVKDIAGVQRISGTADGSIKLTGRGATLGAMRRTLAGNAAFDVKRGALEGIDLWHAIRTAYALAKGRPGPGEASKGKTEFADLSGTAKIDKGVARNDDLKAALPFLRVRGAGKVDLVKQGIDYLVKATVVKVPDVQSGEKLADLKGLTIPVRITGSFSKLSARPDIGEVLKEKAKSAVKKKVEDKAKKALKDIFGGGG